MQNKILAIIKKVSKENNINIDINNTHITLKEAKIDSLAAMNLIIKIEEELNVCLDDETLIKIKTLDDLVNSFLDKLK